MKNVIRYFIQGIVIIVPFAVTILIIVKIISWLDSIFDNIGIAINPYVDSWIAVASAIGIIFLIGLLGSTIFFKPLINLLDYGLENTPFIKTVYSSIKDLLSAFVGGKKKFDKPVLVTTNKENNIQQLGFITNTELQHLHIKNKVAVYVPMSYSISGNLIFVPNESITPIDLNSAEAMKFILSGGVTDID